jgi:putative tryptophan/tyrosine transport system substrate-binding protein
MRRRNLIFGFMAAAVMGGAHAQQSGKAHRIAIVHPSHPVVQLTETNGSPLMKKIFSELRRLGYVEGENLLIERYSGEGRSANYPAMVREVVVRNPDLIIAFSTNLTLDFKAAATTIPIVGVFGVPIEAGIVPNLARPGGNITGVAIDVGLEQWGKRIQLLQQVAPQASILGVLDSRETREQYEDFGRGLHRRMGTTVVGPPLSHPIDESEYRRVFAALAQDRADGILVTDISENLTNRRVIVELAAKYSLPAMYPFKLFVETGGLMSYGIDIGETARRVAEMVGQILKGAKPADIPVFQPTKFELAINLKTAQALALTVPHELLVSADEVIE